MFCGLLEQKLSVPQQKPNLIPQVSDKTVMLGLWMWNADLKFVWIILPFPSVEKKIVYFKALCLDGLHFEG